MKRDIMNLRELEDFMKRVSGKGYGAYKELLDIWIDYSQFTGGFTKVQGDPHAPPSIFEAHIQLSMLNLPPELDVDYQIIRKPLADFLARKLYTRTRKYTGKCGLGNSCVINVPRPSPRILYRSMAEIWKDTLYLRLHVGLPSTGRRVNGREAYRLLSKKIPSLINETIDVRKDWSQLLEHVDNYIIQEKIREWLKDNHQLYFIGKGSILPRETGFSDYPMRDAVPFKPPTNLSSKICIDNRCFEGLLIEEGVNLIIGGAFHGKTTLLKAIIEGIYNHVKGDGRELVISRDDTFPIQSEDGRIINCVDISMFFTDLPRGSTKCFSTLDASGSTSMASSLSELIELGVSHIVFDEDNSATNLLYKDNVMEKLIPEDPIIPLSGLLRNIHKTLGISFTGVITASSLMLRNADKIIKMVKYLPEDYTSYVKKNTNSNDKPIPPPNNRVFKGIRRLEKIRSKDSKILLEYGRTVHELEVSVNPRIVEKGQVKMIGLILEKHAKPRTPLYTRKMLSVLKEEFESFGFRGYSKPVPPDLTEVHPLDVLWVLNRVYRAIFEQA